MEIDLPKTEEKILNFWKRYKIFEKSISQKKRAKDFIFYEGPPTANARPGLHHVLSRVFKDIICRFRTMLGFRVIRKAGWDTHGLPVELEIEKKLGFKTKKDIEKFGIAKFNRECKKSVWEYKKDWEKLTERIGFWLDLKNPYITYETDYIETIWFILKKIWEKGLLYQDFRVSPYCPRCQTVLSSHELAQGYKKIKEPAVYVKFRIQNQRFQNASLLIWTTTPWTLPGNVAVAVGPEFHYVKVKTKEEEIILAKERFLALQIEGKIEEEFLGKELIGVKYYPPFNFYSPDFKKERVWEVLGAEFVSLKEGTGLVHIAPAFGEEDMELIRKENEKSEKKFPILLNVDEEGKFKLEVKNLAGKFVKEADPLIIQELREKGLLFKEELYEHDYPFCWRCKTPLLYYAKKSWFIRMSALKEKLIENNKKINWIPEHVKEGRFGEWLREVKDWALSRERYWGTPLPIWKCQGCENLTVIGSLKELKSQRFSRNRYLILRHGEAISNLKEIMISKIPEKIFSPLTKKGRKQIEKVAQKLKKEKIDLIFSSDFERTKETAEIIAKEIGKNVIFDKRLREIDAGELDGRTYKEYKSFWKDFKERFSKRPKGGENFLDVKKRVVSFIKDVEKKYQNKTILIVSHQAPLVILQASLEGWKLSEFAEKYDKERLELGEVKELKFVNLPLNEKGEIDLHRPFVDKIEFLCSKCGQRMKRVPEVIDCWFDSGSMPFAQYHWLNSKPPKLFPADYIAEGIDQTRGWFYTLLAISTLLDFGPSFKNVIALGHVLDEKGEKMSKSRGNVVDPWLMIKKYGADALRWYFFSINQPGEPKLFSEKDLKEIFKKFILTLYNCFLFFKTYSIKTKISLPTKKVTLLDKWILSRLNKLILNVEKLLKEYQITQAARLIEKFVIEDLSLWYIRRARRRFQKPENREELKVASTVLGFVLLRLSEISAPFLPFLSEYFWHEILRLDFNRAKSVHLQKWPSADKAMIDEKLEKKMEKVREIVAKGLSERAKAKIKVRQPLSKFQIKDGELKKEKELLELIKEELNVKEITFGKEFKLDTFISPELYEEGIIREIIRHIQQIRKNLKLQPKNKILVKYKGDKALREIIEKHKKIFIQEGKIKKIEEIKLNEKFDWQGEVKIEKNSLILAVKKLS